jgi:hypothetical protein
LQPDYIFASEGDMWCFWSVGFWWPQYHDLDHHAVVATIRAEKRWLKAYWRQCQKFPMQLSPQELRDDLKRHSRNWVSEGTWLLIKQRTSH